jgi:hypothetical protein
MHSKLENLHVVPLEVVHTSQMVDVPQLGMHPFFL